MVRYAHDDPKISRFDLKISYLKDFIEVISKVDPGYTKVSQVASPLMASLLPLSFMYSYF